MKSLSPQFGALGLAHVSRRWAIAQSPFETESGAPAPVAAPVVAPVAPVAAPVAPQSPNAPPADPNADLIKRLREKRLARQKKPDPSVDALPNEVREKIQKYDAYVLKETERLTAAAASLSPDEKAVFDSITDLGARAAFVALLSSKSVPAPVGAPPPARQPLAAGAPPPKGTPVDIEQIVAEKGIAYAKKMHASEYSAYEDSFSKKKSSSSFSTLKKA
jgi:hypothetical protein